MSVVVVIDTASQWLQPGPFMQACMAWLSLLWERWEVASNAPQLRTTPFFFFSATCASFNDPHLDQPAT
jgi:hypothetical protein